MTSRGIAPLFIVGMVALALLLAGGSFGGYVLNSSLSTARTELASTTEAKASLADSLAQSREENQQLSEKLAAELVKNNGFEG